MGGQSLWGSVPKEKGLYALTVWKLIRVGAGASLLVCSPETGRTHQIRIHLSEMGYPILGDHHYCKRFTSSYQAPRLMLHAATLELKYKKTIVIHAVWPSDFESSLKSLRLNE